MSELKDTTNINPTNDVFLCAICGQLHPSATIFCEQTGKVILPAEMIPFEDTIECPFCGAPHQKELHYCPETGRLMPILDMQPMEVTQPIDAALSEPEMLEDFDFEPQLKSDDDFVKKEETIISKTIDLLQTPVTKTVIPTKRYDGGNARLTEKKEPSTLKPIKTSAPSKAPKMSASVSIFDQNEEIARYRTNQAMMMIVIAVLLVGLIVAGFFIFQLTQQVAGLETTIGGLQEMVTEIYAKMQMLGQ